MDVQNGGSDSSFKMYSMNVSTGAGHTNDYGNGGNIKVKTDQTGEIRIRIASGYTANNLIFKPKLEKGTVATPWSPHGQGCVKVTICNKNLFDKETVTNGRFVDYSTGNFITREGYCTSDYIKINSNYITISGTNEQLAFYDKDKNYISGLATSKITDIPTNAKYMIITLQTRQIDSVQIEEGSTATSYEEHQSQSYTIPTQQPMRSIGDVRDCFVKKSDGWYERHYIREVVLNGTESWKLLNSTSDYYEFITYNSLKPVAPSSYTFPMASHFGNATNNRCVANGNQLLIRVPASMNITNATEFKNWLQENNVTINYLLAEPLDLPCTQAQIDVLENMPSTYKEMTIINSEDKTEAYLEVSGIYDLNNLINN